MKETKLDYIVENTMRQVIEKANQLHITKEAVVQILEYGNSVCLIYQIE